MDHEIDEKVSFLPVEDIEYLDNKEFSYEQVIENQPKIMVKGLIIHDYVLPSGKYKQEKTDVLIIIPDGYNDTFPDMFFCSPHLILNSTSAEPADTRGRRNFNGVQWQQWSRHSNTGNDWRPGIDGIKSHLRKVDEALTKG